MSDEDLNIEVSIPSNNIDVENSEVNVQVGNPEITTSIGVSNYDGLIDGGTSKTTYLTCADGGSA